MICWEFCSTVTNLLSVGFAEDLQQCCHNAKATLVDLNIETRYKSSNEDMNENVWSPAHRIIFRPKYRPVSNLGKDETLRITAAISFLQHSFCHCTQKRTGKLVPHAEPNIWDHLGGAAWLYLGAENQL